MDEATRDLLLQRFAWVDGHADLWRLFYDAALFPAVVAGLSEPFRGQGVTKVVGLEAKGFILGGAVAIQLQAGFVAVRKPGGLFPGEKLKTRTAADYRGNQEILSLQRASLGAGDRVILVDDWFEKGSQALAAKTLVSQSGATYLGSSIVVDQMDHRVRAEIGNVHRLIDASELGGSD